MCGAPTILPAVEAWMVLALSSSSGDHTHADTPPPGKSTSIGVIM